MRKEFVVVLVALVAVSFVRADYDWCKKSVDGSSYDLNPLRDPDGVTLHHCQDPDDPNFYDYTINVCGFVRHGCNDSYVETVSQKDELHPGDLNCKICAVTSTKDKMVPMDLDKPNLGVFLTTYGGTPYHHDPCTNIPRSVRFDVFCDCSKPNVGALQSAKFVEEQQEQCGPYVFQINAAAGCPIGYCSGSSGGGHNDSDDDGISGGWIFIIILLCLSVIYFGGGMAYKIFAKGARGIEACPNIGFWRSFCGMTKEGFIFVFSGCKTNKSYSTFDDAGVADAGETPAASTKTYGSLQAKRKSI